MNKFLEYRLSDGEITGVFNTTSEYFDQTLRNGFAVIQSDIDPSDGQYYVVNGSLTIRAPRPTIFSEWDGVKWVNNQFLENVFNSKIVRMRRDELLETSDWTDTLSSKQRLGEQTYSQWQEYRQALRDITNQPGFPLDVVWPTKPE